MTNTWIPLTVAVTISAHPLQNEDVLGPSILNEVEHAISIAPTNAPAAEWTPRTNGLSRTDIAVRIVSSQRADGRWMEGTNDVTSAALQILRELSL